MRYLLACLLAITAFAAENTKPHVPLAQQPLRMAKDIAAFEAARCPAGAWITAAAAQHLPALLLARVDGKSPAEYLNEPGRQTARRIALRAMDAGLQHPLEIFELRSSNASVPLKFSIPGAIPRSNAMCCWKAA